MPTAIVRLSVIGLPAFGFVVLDCQKVVATR
jgi:hypothetical protein